MVRYRGVRVVAVKLATLLSANQQGQRELSKVSCKVYPYPRSLRAHVALATTQSHSLAAFTL